MTKELHIIDRIEEEGITVVHAGYRDYKLLIKKVLIEGGDKCLGVTDFHVGSVALIRTMDHETAREVLIHELTHVALELTGIGGSEDDDTVRVHTNEELTTQVSRGFLLLMNLNPKLFSILNERPEDHEKQ